MKNDDDIKMIIEDKWDVVYLKEKPFMPFGSMANAYGLVNKGSAKPIDEFLSDMDKIWTRSLFLTAHLSNVLKSKKKEKASEEIDLPIEN